MTDSLTTPVPKALIETLWHLDGARERSGWDSAPDLLALYEVRCPTHDTTVAIGGAEFPGWRLAMGMTGHSFHAMSSIITGLQAAPRDLVHRLVPPPGLVGVVLIDETWTLSVAPGTPRPQGSLANHPHRVEQRLTWLQTLDGRRALLAHERDGIAQIVDDVEQMGGRLADALAEIARLIA